MNPIGIMQGRLLPPINGRIQSFPAQAWRDEFALARQAGLNCIEWIYEKENEDLNPLGSNAGLAEMRKLSVASGVLIRSICADYFMTELLVTQSGDPDAKNLQQLKWLIGRGGALGIRYIVLPFVDSSSIKTPPQLEGLLAVLKEICPVVEQEKVEIHLETDLQPAELAAVLQKINHPLIRANYDSGNSASLGYDPEEELTLLTPWLASVHIKDRLRGGGTVPLGTGDTKLDLCFQMFQKANYQGFFVLQAARSSAMSEVDWAIANRKFVEKHLSSASNQVRPNQSS